MTLILLIFKVSFVQKAKVSSQLIQQISQTVTVLSKEIANHIFIIIWLPKGLNLNKNLSYALRTLTIKRSTTIISTNPINYYNLLSLQTHLLFWKIKSL